MALKVAINGFGRIGRCVTRLMFADGADSPVAIGEIELVAINDLTDGKTLAHLLAFDSVHRAFDTPVKAEDNQLVIGDKKVRQFAEKDPAKLPWKELGVDVVLECTGIFRGRETGAVKHLGAGAKRVIISAPGEKDIDGTFVIGVNSSTFDASKHFIVSNASCTTNCLAPMTKVLNDLAGITKGHMVTVHSYTNDQNLLDLPHKDLRRARAAALSMIPSSTGAAKAIGLVLPELKGKLDGTSIRVPTPDVSIACLSAVVSRDITREEVNAAFEAAAAGPMKGILGVEKRPLVSSDFIGDRRSSIIDAEQTAVVGGNLVEIQSWYDNEWGFSARMIDLCRVIGK